jgi:CRP/FNR family transcriptional regulator, nitrogen fixation regulation protein
MSTHFDAGNSDRRILPDAGMPHQNALEELDWIRARRSFTRDEEIYAEGDVLDSWYRVASGTVRISKLLPDGRRHIAEFYFANDCFGFDGDDQRAFSAEAVGDVTLLRYPLRATERLIDQNPRLARSLCVMTLRDLAHTRSRTLLLGRMTAAERVASFLLEMSERRDAQCVLDLPMSRVDIADYLGLTIETVCRTLSSFKRLGTIAIPSAHRVEIRRRDELEAIAEGEPWRNQPNLELISRDRPTTLSREITTNPFP